MSFCLSVCLSVGYRPYCSDFYYYNDTRYYIGQIINNTLRNDTNTECKELMLLQFFV